MTGPSHWALGLCRLGCASTAVVVALGLTGCSPPASRHTVARSTSPVSFVEQEAVRENGTIPRGHVLDMCGSARYGWLTEIEHTGLTNARVSREWAAFIPTEDGLAAQQMEASGVITKAVQGTGDVPIDHPYGGDFSFDEHLTPPFSQLDQNLGAPGTRGNPRDTVHDEIMNGLLPHVAVSSVRPPAASWPTYAADVEKGVAAGFLPAAGDAVAVRGSWVVDCGHVDYHSELHSVSFMAYGRTIGDATVAHAFANPYEVSQVYDPVLAHDADMTRTVAQRAKDGKDLLRYIPIAVLRLATGADPALTAAVAMQPNLGSPTPWQVCAPPGSSGRHLRVSYAFATRPGVTVHVTAHDATGCATVTTSIGAGYTTLDPPGQALCSTPWQWLTRALAEQADTVGGLGASTGNLQNDILDQVKAISPSLAQQIAPKLARGVLALCYPALQIAVMASPGPDVRTVRRLPTQSFPFAGWVRVAWT